MNDYDFNKSAQFLESLIKDNLDNNELLSSYMKLLELKNEYDKKQIECETKNHEINVKFEELYENNLHEYELKNLEIKN